MMYILIAVALLCQAVLTIGSVMVWNSVKNSNPTQLPKVFFATTIVRLFVSVVIFALAIWLIHTDMSQVKIFTIVFLLVYMLLLLFDTSYFYCSSQQLNSNK